MRARIAGALVLVTLGAASAHAGRKQILRAFASAIYPVSADADLPPTTCGCVDAPCDRKSDVILGCGGACITGGTAADKARLLVAQPAAAPDGRSECNVCACNDGTTDPLTLHAEGTCLAVPGR
jgi:hypothetical protein